MDTKKENFKRIAENRTNKIISMINSLENLTNSSYYEYSDEQVEEIFKAIQSSLDSTHKAFSSKKNKIRKFEL